MFWKPEEEGGYYEDAYPEEEEEGGEKYPPEPEEMVEVVEGWVFFYLQRAWFTKIFHQWLSITLINTQ